MRNLEEPRELFKRYFELRRATRFLSAGQLKESSDYRSLLQVESKLKDKVNGEIALNLISGTGKEHMAILSALLKLGVGIRLVALTKDGVEEL